MRKFLFLLLISPFILNAQVITTNPAFPTADAGVTITFDASEGNGALAGHTGTVYAHTGVITSNSSSGSDWKYVQGTWGTSSAPEMTSIGNDKYTLNMASIRSFYGVPMGEDILKMAFVFRDLAGNTVGRATGGTDIFVDVFDGGLSTAVLSPQNNSIQQTGTIAISGESSSTASLELFVNGSSVATSSGTTISHNYNASASGNYEIIISANDGSTTVYDTSHFVINPTVVTADVPSGLEMGINYTSSTSITLVLDAPFKNFVYVLGDFNNWNVNTDYFMKRDSDGRRWWLEINGLTAKKTYAFQYYVDAKIKIADPYSELVLDQWNDGFILESTFPNLHPFPAGKTTGIATLIETDRESFNWTSFDPPAEDALMIYELLVRDFVAKHDYQTLVDTLDYLENLGVNAIELMPVNEFEGNESWGYNPSFHMALDKYYGTPEAFKTFIDECHKRGIAVILDVVYNHAFSQSPLCQLYWDEAQFKPTSNNPWVNPDAKHDFNVGYDFNHSSVYFQAFIKRVMTYWLTEYNVDGFRFDLSKGFTQNNTLGNIGAFAQYDQSRIDNLKRIYSECKSVNSDAYLILEHFANNDEETELANRGFMLWGNMNHEFSEAAMGFSSNLYGASHQSRSWSSMRLVGYGESHDEERILYKSKQYGKSASGYNIKSTVVALDRNEIAHVFLASIPGPKMFWQFGELGYDFSIDHNGRTGNKPIKWDYFTQADRKDVYDAYSLINKLRISNDAFSTNNFTLDVGGTGKRIHLNGPQTNAVVLGNFDVTAFDMTVDFQHTGMWYEYFSGDSMNVTATDMQINYEPGEYQVWTDKNLTPKTGSIRKAEIGDLNFYPNPAKSTVSITLKENATVQVITLDGRLIKEIKLQTGKHQLDIADLTPSTYIIKAVGTQITLIGKLTKI